MKYEFIGCDTETTGLDLNKHSVIELSLYRLSNNEQRTWLIKPLYPETIDLDALRVNGHKLEDLKYETKYGRESYKNSKDVIIEIENWLDEDEMPKANRCLIGHNVGFDKSMMERLWIDSVAGDSFPFGRRFLDTMTIELFLDFCKNDFDNGYSLNNLSKKYNVKNEKAHSAAADIKTTVEIFKKQAEFFKKVLNK